MTTGVATITAPAASSVRSDVGCPWKNASPSGAVRGAAEPAKRAPECRPTRGAVDACGLEQRPRRRDEERTHPERTERDRERHLRQDQRPIRDNQPQVAHADREGAAQ